MKCKTCKIDFDGMLLIDGSCHSCTHSELISLKAGKPKIVCLVGSSRFSDIAAVKAWEFEKQGVLALSMNYLPGWYVEQQHGLTGYVHHLGEKENVAHILDELHLKKIDLADFVYVVNEPLHGHTNGYIGDRTRIEIEYAKSKGKPIHYMKPNTPQD